MIEFIEFVVSAVIAVAILLLAVIGPFQTIDYYQCKAFAEANNKAYRWSFECFIEHDGKFVPRRYLYAPATEVRIEDKP